MLEDKVKRRKKVCSRRIRKDRRAKETWERRNDVRDEVEDIRNSRKNFEENSSFLIFKRNKTEIIYY